MKHRVIKVKSLSQSVKQFVIWFLIIGFMGLPGLAENHKNAINKDETLNYEVSVSRRLIPLYAYDTEGNPIYDLKKEELSLYINQKQVEINDLNRISFEYSEETTKKINANPGDAPQLRQAPTERIVFLVVDTMFNSFLGIKRAKKIAQNIINFDTCNTEFVIMTTSKFRGLKMFGKPEKEKNKLKKLIDQISELPESKALTDWNDVSVGDRKNENYTRSYTLIDSLENKTIFSNYSLYFSKLKLILQTIARPKSVIFISENMPESLLLTDGAYALDSKFIEKLKRILKDINEGGSILNVVYSGCKNILCITADTPKSEVSVKSNIPAGRDIMSPDPDNQDPNTISVSRGSDNAVLKALASGPGARYIEGNSEQIVNELHKATSAYYEMAFIPDAQFGNKMMIEVKCSRPNIKLDYTTQLAKNPAYKEMNDIQKKVFAMNAALGRSWAVASGNVKAVNISWQNETKSEFVVKVPEEINGRRVDVFLINFNEDFSNSSIAFEQRTAAGIETIKLKKKSDNTDKNKRYFVMIEPQTGQCLCNAL